MALNLNDPRLTAFALGQLKGRDAEDVKRMMAADPEVAAYVRDIQRVAGSVERELLRETAPALDPQMRKKLDDHFSGKAAAKRVLPGWQLPLGLAAVGAGLASLVAVAVWVRHLPTESAHLARARSQVTADGNDASNASDASVQGHDQKRQLREAESPHLSAALTGIRQALSAGHLPTPESVKITELVNSFSYTYPEPQGENPVAVQVEVTDAPWNKDHYLVRVGVAKGAKPGLENIVLAVDLSGTQKDLQKFALVKREMKHMIAKLGDHDRVTIVVGGLGIILSPTSVADRGRIFTAIDNIEPSSSPQGDGLDTAERTLRQNFIKGGDNRVVAVDMNGVKRETEDMSVGVDFNSEYASSFVRLGEDEAGDAGNLSRVRPGTSKTALYEVVPKGKKQLSSLQNLVSVRVKYRRPENLKELGFRSGAEGDFASIERASNDTRFAAAVAEYALLLKHSRARGSAAYDHVVELAEKASNTDPGDSIRRDFIQMVRETAKLEAKQSH